MPKNNNSSSKAESTDNSKQNSTWEEVVQKLKFVLEILAAMITILPHVIAGDFWSGMLLWWNIFPIIVACLP